MFDVVKLTAPLRPFTLVTLAASVIATQFPSVDEGRA
jgi:hypothetical protein